MNIYLTQGPTTSVRLEGESNVLKYIETRVEGGKLIVGTLHDINLTTSHDLNVYVTLPKLTDVTLSGSGSATLDVDAPSVESTLNGSGKVTLQGQTKDLKVQIAGSADFFGSDLKSENAKVTIMGSGNAHVFSSVKLDVTIGGSGDVTYGGNPALSSNVYGSGSLKKE